MQIVLTGSKTEVIKVLAVLKNQILSLNTSPQNLILVVGVSGGRDSMALLHGLWQLQKTMGFTLVAAHFNHGMRGKAADADEKMVADFCLDYQISFESTKQDIKALAKAEKRNLESCARACRYNWLAEVCHKYEAELNSKLAAGAKALIVTAHHLEDQGETVLLHLLRGSGTQGLAGMKNLQGRLFRPLLATDRADLESYLAEFAIPWRDDATNFEAIYTRNKIRLELWQQLLAYNPRLAEALGNTAVICRGEAEFLEQQVLEKAKTVAVLKNYGDRIGYEIDDKAFQQAAIAIRRRLVRYFWQQTVLQNQVGSMQDEVAYQRQNGQAEKISGYSESTKEYHSKSKDAENDSEKSYDNKKNYDNKKKYDREKIYDNGGLKFKETENLINLKNNGQLTLPQGVFAHRGGGLLYIGCRQGFLVACEKFQKRKAAEKFENAEKIKANQGQKL